MTWPTVCLRGAAVTYSTGDTSFDAIQAIDLDIPPATSHCLVGRSGSGKSTLVSVMALLRRPTRGKMWVNGIDTSTLGDAALSRLRGRFVGTVFQSFHLEAGFTARENTMLAWYFGSELSRRQARARADYLLGVVGIPELVDRPAGQMSGGQRQRVGIARALFSNPRILIADEPTGNLDEHTAGAVSDVIFTLPRQLGTAVVVVTHDPMVAGRAMVTHRLQQGRLTGSHLQRQV